VCPVAALHAFGSPSGGAGPASLANFMEALLPHPEEAPHMVGAAGQSKLLDPSLTETLTL
jgi:hypothetical protein